MSKEGEGVMSDTTHDLIHVLAEMQKLMDKLGKLLEAKVREEDDERKRA